MVSYLNSSCIEYMVSYLNSCYIEYMVSYLNSSYIEYMDPYLNSSYIEYMVSYLNSSCIEYMVPYLNSSYLDECSRWEVSLWSKCTRECAGVRRRTVQCVMDENSKKIKVKRRHFLKFLFCIRFICENLLGIKVKKIM